MDEPSDPTIYSVSEMIDRAFGPCDQNILDMKLMQAVVVILARRLNVLDRWVPLATPSYKGKVKRSKHKVSVAEMKIRAIRKPVGKKYLHTSKTGVLKSKDQLHEAKKKLSTHAVPRSKEEMRKDITEQEKIQAQKEVLKTSTASIATERHKRKKDILETIKEHYEEDGFETGSFKTSKDDAIDDKKISQATKTAIGSSQKYSEEYKSLESEGSTITPEQDEDHDDVSAILSELQRLPDEKRSNSDLQEEKLLVVDLHDDNTGKSAEEIAEGSAIVTQDQFQKLVNKVIDLQKKYGPHDTPDLPAKKIKKKMHKAASLSHAIGAMQLSANVNVIESTTERLFIILREIVIMKIKKAKAAARLVQEVGEEEEEQEEEEEEEDKKEAGTGKKDEERDHDGVGGGGRTLLVAAPVLVYTAETATESYIDTHPAVEHVIIEGSATSMRTPTTTMTSREDLIEAEQRATLEIVKRNVTVQELETAMWHMYDDCFIEFLSLIKHCNTKTAISKERCAKYGEKLKNTLIAEEIMDELEDKIKKYTSRIDEFDSDCTAKTTSIQEQLSQMHQDLESALMDFFESCSKQPRRHVAITELINQFMDLYDQFIDAKALLEQLRVKQEEMAEECSALWKELEVIKDVKDTRQGLKEALVFKASLQELNAYIQKIQGFAVQGDFERRIKRAYEKFNTQEVIWQKQLDDLTRYINDKVDLKLLETFKCMTRNIFDNIESRLDDITKLVGSVPRISDIEKKIRRKMDCISCGAPVTKAMKDYYKENRDPNILEDRAKGGKVWDRKQSKEKDSKVYFPGLPFPHARDPRARFCGKYCGNTSLRLPSLHLKRLRTEKHDTIEREDMEEQKKTPCIACNKPILPPLPGHTTQVEALCEELIPELKNTEILV